METSSRFIMWLQEVGISDGYLPWVLRIGSAVGFLIIALIIGKLCNKFLIPIVRRITHKTQTTMDDYLLSDDVLKNLCRLIPPILANMVVPVIFVNDPGTSEFFLKFCSIYFVVITVKLACSFITGLYLISSEHETLRNHSLKGFYQMIKLVVICIGAIIIISTLINKNPIAILTGLGAGTAILMLIFQDTIKGLVAGIQLMANDMLRPGDWITMPKYGADGDVLEVTLTTVKVQNWDKTITTVPPYALVNESFQNWRGMYDIGGRRVKRSINIDMNTVRFCAPEEMERFRNEPWMEGYEDMGNENVNLHIFRHYMEYYLKHHPKVSQDLIMIVRQLQPTAQGIPVELYFFSADTRWIQYEQLQSEVFEHVLAKLNTFDLRVFQNPTGEDLQKMI